MLCRTGAVVAVLAAGAAAAVLHLGQVVLWIVCVGDLGSTLIGNVINLAAVGLAKGDGLCFSAFGLFYLDQTVFRIKGLDPGLVRGSGYDSGGLVAVGIIAIVNGSAALHPVGCIVAVAGIMQAGAKGAVTDGVVAEGFCCDAAVADQAVDQVIEVLVTVFAGTVAYSIMAVAVGD